jgi:hypothetical protein
VDTVSAFLPATRSGNVNSQLPGFAPGSGQHRPQNEKNQLAREWAANPPHWDFSGGKAVNFAKNSWILRKIVAVILCFKHN